MYVCYRMYRILTCWANVEDRGYDCQRRVGPNIDGREGRTRGGRAGNRQGIDKEGDI